MSLSVINAGFGRTGTMSIKIALEKLGLGPCHHMEEVVKNPSQLPYWQKAAKGEQVNWDDVFAGYGSAVDWPSAHYWRELADYYPDAKVLLSVRPADQWWNSFSGTIQELLKIRDQVEDEYPRSVMYMADEIITQQTFSKITDDMDHALKVFARRIEEVKQTIPESRLLIYQVSEGWEPLCNFLDIPVPDEDFPRTNSKKEFWEVFGGGSEPN